MDAKDMAIVKLARAVVDDNPTGYVYNNRYPTPFYNLSPHCPKCMREDGHSRDCIVYFAEKVLYDYS